MAAVVPAAALSGAQVLQALLVVRHSWASLTGLPRIFQHSFHLKVYDKNILIKYPAILLQVTVIAFEKVQNSISYILNFSSQVKFFFSIGLIHKGTGRT